MEYNKKYNIYGVNRKYESDYGRNIDHNTISPEQALKDLREDAKRHFIEQRQHLNKRLDIIENALKNYEELAQKYNELLYNYQELVNCGLKSEQKKIKTFEIIKEKNVDIRGIKETKDVHEYNVKFPTTLNEFLEEQEYELLKEVLEK